MTKAAWTQDGQFFLFSMQSSGGQQPWHWPLYVYSVRTNRLYDLGDYIGSITSEFVLPSGNRLRTTRMNFETKEDHEPVDFRLGVLVPSRREAVAQLLRARRRTRGFTEKAVPVSAPNRSYAIFHGSTAAARLCERLRGRGIALLF